MEYLEDGDLLKYIKNHGSLSWSQVSAIITQMASCLAYLEERHVAHRYDRRVSEDFKIGNENEKAGEG